jgi:hypothetical protein
MKIIAIGALISAIASSITGAETEFERQYKNILREHNKSLNSAVQSANENYLESLEALLRKPAQVKDPAVTLRVKSALEAAKFDNESRVLRDALIGTKWDTEGRVSKAYTFEEDGRFRSSWLAPMFVVTGRRSLTIIWAPKTNVPCEFNEDCTVMTELAGERQVWRKLR